MYIDNMKSVKISKVESLEIRLSHAEEALYDIYKCNNIDEIKNIVYTAIDKITLGEPEQFLNIK